MSSCRLSAPAGLAGAWNLPPVCRVALFLKTTILRNFLCQLIIRHCLLGQNRRKILEIENWWIFSSRYQDAFDRAAIYVYVNPDSILDQLSFLPINARSCLNSCFLLVSEPQYGGETTVQAHSHSWTKDWLVFLGTSLHCLFVWLIHELLRFPLLLLMM